MRIAFATVLLFAAAGLCLSDGPSPSPADKAQGSDAQPYFGRRLEPSGHKVIHGAGQHDEDFNEYLAAIGDHKPIVYMCYIRIQSKMFAADIDRNLAPLRDNKDLFLVPQLGLSLAGATDFVAGNYDENLETLCKALAAFDRPVYVRIGFEFNGEWNKLEPEPYVAAWKKVVAAFRKHKLGQVATVWCYAPDGRRKDYMAYYPGDDWVDWWGIDLFSRRHFTAEDTVQFMEEARRRKFPVMIGESTPRRVGVHDGERSWRSWFADYFSFMRRYPHCKMFCYISNDWAKRHAGLENVGTWGDSRIGANAEVLKLYQKELTDPLFLHGGDEKIVRKMLNAPTPGSTDTAK